MTLTKRARLSALAVAMIGFSCLASAAPVQWSLNYDNTGNHTVAGSFVYDADINVFSVINITGNDIAAFNILNTTYTTTNPATSNTASLASFWNTAGSDLTGAKYITIELRTDAMTNAGGVISLLASSLVSDYNFIRATRCNNADCSATTSYGINDSADGSLVGTPLNVPEPGTLALVGLSLFMACAARLRT